MYGISEGVSHEGDTIHKIARPYFSVEHIDSMRTKNHLGKAEIQFTQNGSATYEILGQKDQIIYSFTYFEVFENKMCIDRAGVIPLFTSN